MNCVPSIYEADGLGHHAFGGAFAQAYFSSPAPGAFASALSSDHTPAKEFAPDDFQVLAMVMPSFGVHFQDLFHRRGALLGPNPSTDNPRIILIYVEIF